MLWQRKLRYRFAKPGKNKKSKRRGLVLLCIGVGVIAAALLFVRMEHRIGTVARQAAISKWNGMILSELSRATAELADSYLTNPGELLFSGEQKEILSFDADLGKVNRMKSELALRLQSFLEQNDTVETTLPVGFLASETLLTGAGVRIPVKMYVTGTPEINFHDEFTEAGVNQTRIMLMCEVKVSGRAVGLLESEDTVVTAEVPIAEKIVIGKVPDMVLYEKSGKSMVPTKN